MFSTTVAIIASVPTAASVHLPLPLSLLLLLLLILLRLHLRRQLSTTQLNPPVRQVATFINATTDREIVFTRNASEAINLVANTWGAANLRLGDEVVISELEHHSNLVPWQLICKKTGATLRYVGLAKDGSGIDMAGARCTLQIVQTPRSQSKDPELKESTQ